MFWLENVCLTALNTLKQQHGSAVMSLYTANKTKLIRWIKYRETAKFADNSKTKILHCSVRSYDTVYFGRWLLTFRRNILPPSSENKWYLPIRPQHGHTWTYKDLIVLFSTANLIENIRKYEIYPVLSPICTVAMAVTAMYKYFVRVRDSIRIPIPGLFNNMRKANFLIGVSSFLPSNVSHYIHVLRHWLGREQRPRARNIH
jgi:hypothetical protein